MRAILKIAAIMLLIYLLANLSGYNYVFTDSSGFLLLAAISGGIYILFRPIRKPPALPNEQNIANKSNVVINNKPGVNSGSKWIYGFVIFIVVVYLFRDFLGDTSFKIFLFLDNMLHFQNAGDPVFMWIVLGLFAGLVCGSFVAYKKYRLPFTVNLIPAGIFLLVIFILITVNDPARSPYFNNETFKHGLTTDADADVNAFAKDFIIKKWEVEDLKGKNRESYLRKKSNLTSEFEFMKNGKGYRYENSIKKETFYYTIAPDGKTLLFTDPKTLESKQVQIIYLTKDQLMMTSEKYKNDTVILKAK